jgi:hypothetical protein
MIATSDINIDVAEIIAGFFRDRGHIVNLHYGELDN